MKRFCYFCAGSITDIARILRGAIYCSPKCRRDAAAELRKFKHGSECGKCLRKFRNSPKRDFMVPSTPEPVAESAQGCNAQESANADGGLTR